MNEEYFLVERAFRNADRALKRLADRRDRLANLYEADQAELLADRITVAEISIADGLRVAAAEADVRRSIVETGQ